MCCCSLTVVRFQLGTFSWNSCSIILLTPQINAMITASFLGTFNLCIFPHVCLFVLFKENSPRGEA